MFPQGKCAEGLTVNQLAAGDHALQVCDRSSDHFNLLTHFKALRYGRETGCLKDVHALISEPGTGEEDTNRANARGSETSLFLKFARCRQCRVFTGLQLSGTEFIKPATNSHAPIANHDQSAVIEDRNDRDGAGMTNNIANDDATGVVAECHTLNGKHAAPVDGGSVIGNTGRRQARRSVHGLCGIVRECHCRPATGRG